MVYLVRRFFASYIDAFFVSVVVVIFHILYSTVIGISIFEEEGPPGNYWLKWQLIAYLFYYILFEFLFKRTIGKMLLKFRILGFDESLNLSRLLQVFKRTISRFIPFEPISILLDEERIMWHDKISKTKVIDVRKK